MYAAVDVGVVLAVVLVDGAQHRLRLLGRRGIVQINQRLPIHLLVEDGEVTTYLLDIESRMPAGDREFAGNHIGSSAGHPSSSQFLSTSAIDVRPAVLPAGSQRLVKPSRYVRTGPGRIRSRHSLAKAYSSRRRAAA